MGGFADEIGCGHLAQGFEMFLMDLAPQVQGQHRGFYKPFLLSEQQAPNSPFRKLVILRVKIDCCFYIYDCPRFTSRVHINA